MTIQAGIPGTNSSLISLGEILLFQLLAANFQLTTDQVLQKIFSGTAYQISAIFARPRSGAASVACAGGIYDAAAKTGNILVAAAQNWVTLSSTATPPVGVLATLNLPNDVFTNSPILSLTTGSTAAITADVFVYGRDVL